MTVNRQSSRIGLLPVSCSVYVEPMTSQIITGRITIVTLAQSDFDIMHGDIHDQSCKTFYLTVALSSFISLKMWNEVVNIVENVFTNLSMWKSFNNVKEIVW